MLIDKLLTSAEIVNEALVNDAVQSNSIFNSFATQLWAFQLAPLSLTLHISVSRRHSS